MNNIKMLREKRGYSQEHISKALGISQQAIAKWENEDTMPRADKLPELARILGCTIDELFEDKAG